MEEADRKEAFLEKLEAHLREWDGMWEVLKAGLAQKHADLKLDASEVLEQLEATHAQTRQGLERIRQSADQNWDQFKAQADKVLSDLEDGMTAVRARLKAGAERPDADMSENDEKGPEPKPPTG